MLGDFTKNSVYRNHVNRDVTQSQTKLSRDSLDMTQSQNKHNITTFM